MTSTTTSPTSTTGMSAGRVFNFCAGPATIPEPVLQEVQQDVWNINGTGIGIMEHSHRGAMFLDMVKEAEADCRSIGNISDDYHVLFLPGGATQQFGMIPLNFLQAGMTADYANTGVWTKKAIADAKAVGNVNVAFDGATCNFDHTPTADEINESADAVYFHYCANNTIYGTQFNTPPKTKAPLICDASSEIFSRPLDLDNHVMVYAGGQKNLGPSGISLVIIRKDFAERERTDLPSMMRYTTHAKAGSVLNTPPTFGIYLMGRMFKWIKSQGSLTDIARMREEKAKFLYDAIDGSGGFYTGLSRIECRSPMNVSFKTTSEDLDAKFIAEAGQHGLATLKGHRSTGGMRASIYNAMPKAGCQALAQFMNDFAQRNG